MKNTLSVILIFSIFTATAQVAKDTIYNSTSLKIVRVSKNTFVHISYLNTDSFGRVACNGRIATDKNQALIFDTPTDDSTSYELLKAVEKKLHCKVVGIVVNHFHNDCLGGLLAFHKKGIPSYASAKTLELAKTNNKTVPKNGFEQQLALKVGNKMVINEYFGEAHTTDNIVSYFPSEKVLFGGCMIKEIDATKGFLGDANTKEWSNTVRKIPAKYPEIKYVIPGHGNFGGQELFDYTIKLFEVK